MREKYLKHITSLLTILLLTFLIKVNALADAIPDELSATEHRAIKTNLPLEVVPHVDLSAYQGEWYEIASIPMFFQRKCAGEVKATYTLLKNDQVDVLNTCGTRSGKTIKARGRAKVASENTAKLKVTFLNIFGWRFFASGDYWVTQLADDYRYAVVGHPERKYGWILARTPSLPKTTLRCIQHALEGQGYKGSQFLMTRQKEGGFTFTAERPSLTDYLQQN